MPLLLFAAPTLAQPTWPALGGNAAHESRSTLASVPSLAVPTWNRSTDDQGRVITWNAASGVVVSRDALLALGSIVNGTTQHRLWCLDRFDGSVRWSISVDAPNLSSWSTPTIDERRNTVLVAAGSSLTAYALASGAQQWRTTLQAPIVNASPIVTSDLGLADRAFITDYDGFGAAARLYCINVAPTNAANPFAPGAIVWSVMIGAASGNTAAVRDGRVYVSSVGDWGFAPGQILCFDARATPTPGNAPAPLWTFDNPSGESFFGGVCVTADDAAGGSAHGGALFAASYAFYGSTLSANLIKLDARTGALKWSTPCNRTASIPVPLSGGRIALSGGLQGYGTAPTLQLFADNGTSATLLWDSSLATWTDTNNNGSRDVGEFTPFGGWHNQPVALSDRTRLALGTIASGSDVSGYGTLSIVNTSVAPSSASFVVAQRSGIGASPAAAGSNLYSLGASGLMAFGPPPPRCDVNADGRVDIDDLYAWEQGSGTRDVNRDGSVSSADRDALIAELRRDERADMEGTRR
ncbi:MAG: PQQ-binding-like beta-propeller repeat protein [Planctomycetota bacterium]|nr:PQQ-binding-like beta-propeller repeat protein [Planctomycetota bacterium]